MTNRLLLVASFLLLVSAVIFLIVGVPILVPALSLVAAFGFGAAYLSFRNK